MPAARRLHLALLRDGWPAAAWVLAASLGLGSTLAAARVLAGAPVAPPPGGALAILAGMAPAASSPPSSSPGPWPGWRRPP